MAKDSFDGIPFKGMSNNYLVQCVITLAERCGRNDDWAEELHACETELLNRLREYERLQIEHGV